MGTRQWPHAPGTCRAVIAVHGPQVIVCHPCRRYTAMPPLEVPFYPCPFVCRWCGGRGTMKDAAEAPKDYAHETRASREFLAPKLRWRPTR
jgi:hypothetical protein